MVFRNCELSELIELQYPGYYSLLVLFYVFYVLRNIKHVAKFLAELYIFISDSFLGWLQTI